MGQHMRQLEKGERPLFKAWRKYEKYSLFFLLKQNHFFIVAYVKKKSRKKEAEIRTQDLLICISHRSRFS